MSEIIDYDEMLSQRRSIAKDHETIYRNNELIRQSFDKNGSTLTPVQLYLLTQNCIAMAEQMSIALQASDTLIEYLIGRCAMLEAKEQTP